MNDWLMARKAWITITGDHDIPTEGKKVRLAFKGKVIEGEWELAFSEQSATEGELYWLCVDDYTSIAELDLSKATDWMYLPDPPEAELIAGEGK